MKTMMNCPYLIYKDGSFLSYEYFCSVTGQKIGTEYDRVKVESTCKDNKFFDCPLYKKKKGL